MASERVAVVVGVCAHGLAISRALSRAGIDVIALEANRDLPGVRTRFARIRFVDDINGPGLVDALMDLAAELAGSERPVLFLTNDTMVATVGAAATRVAQAYRLSWHASANALVPLLDKSAIEARCRETGLHYPKSHVYDDFPGPAMSERGFAYPVIFKPTRPVSAYKTLVMDDPADLDSAWNTLRESLPGLVQEFIPGDDSRICVAALYLSEGRVLARFEGRKLRSRPMGHTTVAVAERNDLTHELAKRFFAGLELSGPVALELKRDARDEYWVIEPTVGRTDFWVGLCIADGVNFPEIEYAATDGATDTAGEQRDATLWINGERDPAALLWLLYKRPGALFKRRITGVYLDVRDFAPWVAWFSRYAAALPGRALRKSGRLLRRVTAGGSGS